MSEAETGVSVQERLASMVANGEHADYKSLKAMFAELEPTTNEFMFGQWRGGTFSDRDTGNFYGKRFNSEEHCEPMLRTKEDGTIFAWPDWGEARLREIAYEGKVQSTIIYDDRPLMDYFRKVNDDLVLGLGDLKGQPKMFFWLARDK
ncbi:DUF4334 domain-containing protein [Sphingobium chlorophenolicum]|uniref:DUF4334 domain-containing protein n=1 Tax=Sphingobium chlorophenolicum TaxID=46429 RepID=A0A081R8U5_SPHCR|nr:DUF4334 domain-containing protein [Sphingobium chlorophenolicum]KEQ51618.1 hypothetical protein BV95_04121 [Sphingobium chlorophenolicum]